MMVILPLIILISHKHGFFEMKENTFCRTEHLGTENLGAFHKIQNLQFPNFIALHFLPYHTVKENTNKK